MQGSNNTTRSVHQNLLNQHKHCVENSFVAVIK